jgi:NAD(P)-dependent dehydrogenase (short-subunit alcohol dehydrogenase family)
MNLEGKVSLITGGTRGIGAATAYVLARAGSDIAILGRHIDAEAGEVEERIKALGRRCETISADVGKPGQALECVRDTAERLGRLDVLVHSAGGPVVGGLFEISPETWEEAFAVHVHSVFYLARAAVPLMKEQKEGAIILVSSAAGLRGFHTNLAYQVVKGALPQFARALARELSGDNIRVNCVAPGLISTRFHAAMPEDQRHHNIQHRIPLHREGRPEDVADLIRELIANDYITGETVAIDGGLTMRIV